MSELTCDAIIVKDMKYGGMAIFKAEVGEALNDYHTDYIEIGRTTITVEIKDDTTSEEVEALKAEKRKIGAEAQVKINNIEERIQSMLCIESDS